MQTERLKVPFFDYSALADHPQDDVLDLVNSVVRRGAFILQSDLREFEYELAEYCGVRHAIGVGNGTDALAITLRAAGITSGDVVLPSHTFVATAEAVVAVGANPVLVDCGDDHLVAADEMAAAIGPNTRALVPVHLNGRACEMDKICLMAEERGLIVVEDAAQALGANYMGQRAGSFGLAGAFSFYPAKALGCFGDGGAIVTNNDSLARMARAIRDHGRTESGEILCWGVNSRLDNLHAAVLRRRLSALPTFLEKRRSLARIYDHELALCPGVKLPPGPDVAGPNEDVFQNYEIEADFRDELVVYLSAEGIGTSLPWGGKAIHQLPALALGDSVLPRTEAILDRAVLLPMNHFIEESDVRTVCGAIMRFYKEEVARR